MKRIHALWPSWLLALGLVLAFFGERVFSTSKEMRVAFDAAAALALFVSALARGLDFLRAPREKKRVATVLFLGSIGAVIALASYALLPLAFAGEGHERIRSVLWAAWPLLLVLSVLPVLAVELAVGPVAYNPEYEHGRVHEAVRRSVGLALLVGVLVFSNLLAFRHDAKWEMSAGNRAVASEETRRAVRDLTKEVRVVAFWPRANEVGDVVMRYFEPLVGLSSKLTVERRDHALASELAARAGVTENGWLVLLHDERKEKIRVGDKARNARSALRRLDREILEALVRVTMRKRVAYYTTGHGERALERPDEDDPRPPMTLLRQQLEAWQFEVAPFGVAQGSTESVPTDASVILILDPQKPFLRAEVEALGRGLARGARLLLTLDPAGDEMRADSLLSQLGLRFDPVPLANERANVPLTRTKADRSLIWSNRYSSHPSVTTMSRNNRLATVLETSGSLEKLEGGPTLAGAGVDVVLTAVEDTFRDTDRDLERDPDERSETYALAAAVTKTSTSGPAAETRAFVLADTDVFADPLMKQVQGNLMLFRDVIYWLQVDEEPIVPTVSEKDVRIVHKSDEDAVIFYGTTFGAPALVLGLGSLATRRRRRR